MQIAPDLGVYHNHHLAKIIWNSVLVRFILKLLTLYFGFRFTNIEFNIKFHRKLQALEIA